MTTTDTRKVRVATASHVGGRSANADAAYIEQNELGVGASVVDGIGSSLDVCRAARLAAEAAASVASHRGAQAGIMAAADTMPDYPAAPNAVAAVVSYEPGGRIEVAHVGDAAVYVWSRTAGLRRWTVVHTAGEHVRHMLTNPGLGDDGRAALRQCGPALKVLDDYVLNGLKYSTVSTVSWTPLRGEDADVDLVLLTSDGVHKQLADQQISALVERHGQDVQALVDALVASAVAAVPAGDSDNATAAVLLLGRGL